jgi:transglutaminase superfamily protein
MKPFWIGAGLFGLLFAMLFSIRIDFFKKPARHTAAFRLTDPSAIIEKDSWMNVIQKGRKIGFSHSIFMKAKDAFRLEETLNLRINTMGMIQDLTVKTAARFHFDLTLAAFDMHINSGRFQFSARGSVSEHILTISTEAAGDAKEITLAIEEPLYLFSGMIRAVSASDLKPGETRRFYLFDPVTMAKAPVDINVHEMETIRLQETSHRARKLSFSFKGATQFAWVGENGDVLKESGILGISLERTSRAEALYGQPVESSQDLAAVASIVSNIEIENPATLDKITVKLDGLNPDNPFLNGGRQTYKDRILTIRRESLSGLASGTAGKDRIEPEFLKPAPFIQSDHPTIKTLAKKITAASRSPLSKAIKLVSWMQAHIEKRPVLSLPDALSTLNNRMGDCNEHAVLLAALARAAGIPTRLEAGLTYLNGRFYYHAWNLLYLGEWITADAALGQLPADVTHIRFSSGAHSLPLDLIGVIGKIHLTVIGVNG